MKHTLKVYKGTELHSEYMDARFDKNNPYKSFPLDGHRWAYQHTSFDDNGDYDLLYRFDDRPEPEEKITVDELSTRDCLAGLAMQGMIANPAMIDNATDSSVEWLARNSYKVADAMLAARNT
ncbi:hypothetical protein SOASR014_42030 [Pectobacterium carotovorum subsp. carotovorum]|nr:hypothetical protein SOASR014_42030 [Pectobacterium carotovorum subsp. carotovorum]GLX46520.1 hypothetical protein Pcaca01_41880 [Pectobacterium carotovorum subsp. carotovorum]